MLEFFLILFYLLGGYATIRFFVAKMGHPPIYSMYVYVIIMWPAALAIELFCDLES